MYWESWNLALHRTNFNSADICPQDIPEMLDHLIGVIVAIAVGKTPQPRKIPQTVIAVAGSAMQHGIALQLQSSPLTVGSPACEIITFKALDEVESTPKLCFFLPKLDASILSNIDRKLYPQLRKLTTSDNGLF